MNLTNTTGHDITAMTATVSAAFMDLPPSQWLIPDPRAREQVFPDYFQLYVELGLLRGRVYSSNGHQAVAIWLPITTDTHPALPGYNTRLAAITGAHIDRFTTFDTILEECHPATEHDHLAILAVSPALQGQGIGTALLERHHRVLDQRRRRGYLEAASERDAGYYEKRSWHRLGDPFTLPGGPPMWPMWRHPDTRPGTVRRQP